MFLFSGDASLIAIEIPSTDYWARFISVESTDTDSQKLFRDIHTSVSSNLKLTHDRIGRKLD